VTLSPGLDERLREAAARMHRAEHVRHLRETTAQQIEGVRSTLEDLEFELAEEERDVARLESGLSAVLARMLGNREERLERERAEAAVARERVDGHRARLAQLEADAAAAAAELAVLDPASREYAQLLAQKEQQLIRSGDPRARELADLGAALDRLSADVRECEEARQAGQGAHEALGVVLRFLDSARNASTFDVFGGGLLADAYEHDKLTSADKAAWHAQRALDVFAHELADTGIAARPVMPKVDTR
jgi:chromosome segregation ATPase